MEDRLDRFIICPKCHSLHRKVKLRRGRKALCQRCNSLLYREYTAFIDNLLAVSLVSLILLIMSYTFSIMKINLNGISQHLNIISLFDVIFSNQYYLVGFILSFLIFIFPILINILMVMVLISMKLRRYPYFVKRVLILIAKLLPWSMLDIFYIYSGIYGEAI